MSLPLRLELRFKNATLFNALVSMFPPRDYRQRYADFRSAAKAVEITYSELMGFLNFSTTPFLSSGSPRPSAERLSFLLNISFEQLFPLELYRNKLPKMLAKDVDGTRFIGMLEARKEKLLPRSTEEIAVIDPAEREELKEHIDMVLRTLTPREQHVIERFYGLNGKKEAKQGEIGEEMGVSSTQIHNIHTKALTRLRHPSRSRGLRQFQGA